MIKLSKHYDPTRPMIAAVYLNYKIRMRIEKEKAADKILTVIGMVIFIPLFFILGVLAG